MRVALPHLRLVALSTVAIGLSACGGSSSSISAEELEKGIATDYAKQLNQEAAKNDITGAVRVEGMDCVKKGDAAARCFATVAGGVEGRVPIEVTIDGAEYLWETDESAFAALQPTAPETAEADPDTGGQIDPLKFITAAGRAGDDINDARLDGDVLVLELAGDPADINTDDIKAACPKLRDEFNASSVEVETPDGERTPSC